MLSFFQKLFQDTNFITIIEFIKFHDFCLILIFLIVRLLCFFLGFILINKFTRSIHFHANNLEIFWTVIPAIILIFLAIPSLRLLYLTDELINTNEITKSINHQSFWAQQYNLFNDQNSSVLSETKEDTITPRNFLLLKIEPVIYKGLTGFFSNIFSFFEQSFCSNMLRGWKSGESKINLIFKMLNIQAFAITKFPLMSEIEKLPPYGGTPENIRPFPPESGIFKGQKGEYVFPRYYRQEEFSSRSELFFLYYRYVVEVGSARLPMSERIQVREKCIPYYYGGHLFNFYIDNLRMKPYFQAKAMENYYFMFFKEVDDFMLRDPLSEFAPIYKVIHNSVLFRMWIGTCYKPNSTAWNNSTYISQWINKYRYNLNASLYYIHFQDQLSQPSNFPSLRKIHRGQVPVSHFENFNPFKKLPIEARYLLKPNSFSTYTPIFWLYYRYVAEIVTAHLPISDQFNTLIILKKDFWGNSSFYMHYSSINSIPLNQKTVIEDSYYTLFTEIEKYVKQNFPQSSQDIMGDGFLFFIWKKTHADVHTQWGISPNKLAEIKETLQIINGIDAVKTRSAVVFINK